MYNYELSNLLVKSTIRKLFNGMVFCCLRKLFKWCDLESIEHFHVKKKITLALPLIFYSF